MSDTAPTPTKTEGAIKRYLKNAALAWKDGNTSQKLSLMLWGATMLVVGASIISSGGGLFALPLMAIYLVNISISSAAIKTTALEKNFKDIRAGRANADSENLLNRLKAQDTRLQTIWQKPLNRLPEDLRSKAQYFNEHDELTYLRNKVTRSNYTRNAMIAASVGGLAVITAPTLVPALIFAGIGSGLAGLFAYVAHKTNKNIKKQEADFKAEIKNFQNRAHQAADKAAANLNATAAPQSATAAPAIAVAAPVIAPIAKPKRPAKNIGTTIGQLANKANNSQTPQL